MSDWNAPSGHGNLSGVTSDDHHYAGIVPTASNVAFPSSADQSYGTTASTTSTSWSDTTFTWTVDLSGVHSIKWDVYMVNNSGSSWCFTRMKDATDATYSSKIGADGSRKANTWDVRNKSGTHDLVLQIKADTSGHNNDASSPNFYGNLEVTDLA